MANDWIDELEFVDANIKWGFSHFDGKANGFNEEGDHNFTIIVPEDRVKELQDAGWNVKFKEGREEGDPGEWILKVNISYRLRAPQVYLVHDDPNNEGKKRMMKADESDLDQIRRDSTDQIDCIITPHRWVNGNRTGVSAYVKEMYVTIRKSRLAMMYDDVELI